MATPRERGFRARFAGQEFRPGMERDSRSASCRNPGSRWEWLPRSRFRWAPPRGVRTRWRRTCLAAPGHGAHDGHDGRDGHSRPRAADGRRCNDTGRAVGRRSQRRIRLIPAGRRPVLQLGVRAEPRPAQRRRLDMEPQLPVALRRQGGALSLNGDVRSTMLGADYSPDGLIPSRRSPEMPDLHVHVRGQQPGDRDVPAAGDRAGGLVLYTVNRED